MATQTFTYAQKTPAQIRTDYLRTLKNGLISIGIANPNVGPGSPDYVKGTALANEIAVGQANIVISVDNDMPDTAIGAGLDRWGAIVNRIRRTAVGSEGVITPTISAPGGTNIVQGSQLTDTGGLRYQVITGGTYTNGQTVPIAAIDTGAATNHVNGDVLTWVNPPPFTAPTATVGLLGGTDGLVDGADSEIGNDEPYRARILQAMQSPTKDGNAAEVAALALASSDNVGLACVYPALLGPGTAFVAVSAIPQTTAPLSSNAKSRALPSALVSGTVLPYIQGALGGQPYIQALSTTDEPVDLAIQLFLPSAPTASPPGPGGGWLDGAPWPLSVGGTAPVVVTIVSGTTVFTVNATTPPQIGVSRIACLSTANWQLYTATVLSYTGSSGAYDIVVDTPMPFITNGAVIFPQSVNQQTYVNALFSAFAQMGPGEWTTIPAILSRAFRHPSTALSNPSTIGALLLKPIISSGPEVADATFLYRSATNPNVPTNASTAPSIFVPRNIGFYPS